jgi:hypothetical protein
MTRVIRSRRAGLSREQARQQPLYARMLGLQYLAPSGFLCFVFLEGAVALGVLLALAELVSWWGVIVLPATVAVMVKLNDVIAGAVSRPAAAADRAATPPRSTTSATGASAEGGARPPAADGLSRRPGTGTPPDVAPTRSPRGPVAAAGPALRSAVVRPPGGEPGPLPGEDVGGVFREDVALRHARTVDLRPRASHGTTSVAASTAVDAGPLNGPPSARQWAGQPPSARQAGEQWGDQLDGREQRARQSATRRYE